MNCLGQYTNRLLLGPSASSSSSNPVTTSTQNSVQGASGTLSPTTTITGSTATINDPQLQLATVQALSNTVQEALAGGGSILNSTLGTLQNLTSGLVSSGNQQQSSSSDLLGQALEAEQYLAAAQGTGGASITQGTQTNIIYAVVAIAIAGLLAVIFLGRHK